MSDWKTFWQTAHLRHGKEGWAEAYFNSWAAPHRQELIRAVEREPFEDLLELGCGSGPNLRALWGAGMTAHLHGVDINADAIAYGQEQFKALGMKTVSLEVGDITDLSALDPYDVVVAVAVFMHVPPAALHGVLDQALRLARKRLILVDLHTFTPFLGAKGRDPHRKDSRRWARNWWTILARHGSLESVSIAELCSTRAAIGDINALIDVHVEQSRRREADGSSDSRQSH